MLIVFQLITICVIWCMGIKIATSEGMIFQKLGEWGENKVEDGHKIFEALLVCPYCLPSIHTFVAIGLAFGIGIIDTLEWKLLFMYPIVVMGSSFINGYLWGMHRKQNAEHEFLESAKYTSDSVSELIEDLYEQEVEKHFGYLKN